MEEKRVAKGIRRILLSIMMLTFIAVGLVDVKSVQAMANTELYLEVGESYTMTLASSNYKLTYDSSQKGVGYNTDGTKVVAASISGKTLSMSAKAYGTCTFYVAQKDGTKLRKIKMHVYRTTVNQKLSLTNSTSTTNGSKKDVSVYLYKGQTSSVTASQYLSSDGTSTSYPSSVSGDTSGKARACTQTVTTSNSACATISGNTNTFTITAKEAGSALITMTRTWTTSTGQKHTLTRSISVYVYTTPTINIYSSTNNKLCTNNTPFTWYDANGISHIYKFYYVFSAGTGNEIVSSVNCTVGDSNALTVSKSGTNVTFKPTSYFKNMSVYFTVVANGPVYTHNGASKATFNSTTFKASYIHTDKSYITSINFAKSEIKGEPGSNLTQKASYAPLDAISPDIVYTSSDGTVASVDSNGNVKAVSMGTAIITGTSAYNSSIKASYKVYVTAPVPKNVKAVSSINGIRISWSESDGASGYNIYRATSLSGTYSSIGQQTSGTSYTDEKASMGITYYYKIRAISPKGNSCMSDYSSAAYAKMAPVAPKIITVKRAIGGLTQITLSQCSGDGFIIYDVTSSETVLATTTSTSATVSLQAGDYVLAAKSYIMVNDERISSKYSDKVFISVSDKGKVTLNKVSIATRPKKLKAVKSSKKVVKVSWKKSEIYEVQVRYSTNKTFAGAKTKNVKTSKKSVKLKNLKSGKTYYIKIRFRKKVNGSYKYSLFTKRVKVKL